MNEIILTSSVLILIIAALRRVLRGHITPTLQYALWLLVALRLLIPGTLFTAPVIALGLAEDIRSAVVESFPEETPQSITPAPPVSIPEQTITIEPLPAPDHNNETNRAPAPQVIPTPAPSTIDWRDVIWKAGMIVTGSALFVSNLVFFLKLRRSRQRISDDNLPVSCPVPVYYVQDLASPCLFGLKSAIYVNQAAIAPQHLRHVIAHELIHRRHGDHFWALLRCICLAVHWYNPLVWWAAILSRRDCETSCDSAVLHRLGDTSAIHYGETLLAMLTAAPASILHTATTMRASKQTMAERLKLIVHRPRMMKLTVVAIALVAMSTVMFTFGGCSDDTDTNDPSSDISDTNDTVQSEQDKQTESSDQTNDEGKLTPPDGGFGYIPSPTYAHPSGLFTMKLPNDCPVVTVESEDGVSFYDSAVYQSGSEDGWILSVQPQPADWNGNQNPTLTLATFDPNGTQQVYVLEYSEAYQEQFTDLRDWITASFTLQATAELFSRLIHDNYEENLALAISYLPYLNWRNYRELYDFLPGIEPLQTALWQFANSGEASWGQYHDMLSMTNDGLDGAFSQNLADIFTALFINNQERFLSVVNSVYITDTERTRIAGYVKYELESEPTENDSEEITFSDAEVANSLSRSYGSSVWSEGSPEGLTLTLTGDWTLDGIKAALFAAVSEHVTGTLLEGDLAGIEIGYGFRFPDEMRDGVSMTVPFYAIYQDQDAYTLPSGQLFYRGGRTGELNATIQLVGEGITGPIDEEFAKGQAIYALLEQLVTIDEITASLQAEQFGLLDAVCAAVEQRIIDAGLSDICRTSSMSCGQHYNPLWCNVGYEQSVDYSVTLMYTEGEQTYTYTFRRTVTLITVE